jgi:glycine/D-amino acid oxidase-like deaminating enzyme
VLEGTRVERLEPTGGGVRLVLAGGGAVEAGRVLVAANAYLPALVPELGAVVRPVRAQMLATAPVAPVLPVPVYSHDGFYYARQTADGRVLLGGARHLHEAGEVGHEDATTPALQADLEAYLRAHVPGAAGAPVERRWSGTMGFSPDGLPVLGDVPGVPGAVYAAGFTGHGMGYGLRFGRLAARRLLGEPDDAADLFDAARLAS